jgi:hypothetical protein
LCFASISIKLLSVELKESNSSRRFTYKNNNSPIYHHCPISNHVYPDVTPGDFEIVGGEKEVLKIIRKNVRILKGFKIGSLATFFCLSF